MMRIGLLAEKIGMTRFYDKEMVNHSVTILKVQNCKIISKKNKEKHGYYYPFFWNNKQKS